MTNHPNRGALPRPAIMLREIARRYPNAWQTADQIRQDRGKHGRTDWPNWCYLPVPAWAVALGVQDRPFDPQAVLHSGIAAAVGAWRVSQGIYRFNQGLYGPLVTTDLTREIPIDILYRLPEWCVYIETPGFVYLGESDPSEVFGAWVHLDYGHKTGQTKLRAVLDTGNSVDDLIPLGCPLIGTVADSIQAALEMSALNIGQHGQVMPDLRLAGSAIGEVLCPLVSLVLYLCTTNADYGGKQPPSRPHPKRTKREWRLFPPDRPTVWEVGSRIGAALRAAHLDRQTEQPAEQTDSGRARPLPHIRRAHWHAYLVGEGRANSILKWLPPIPKDRKSVV